MHKFGVGFRGDSGPNAPIVLGTKSFNLSAKCFAELDVNHGGFGGPLRETVASTTGDVLSAVTYVVLTPLMVMDQVSSSLNKFLPGVHDMIDCNLFRNC